MQRKQIWIVSIMMGVTLTFFVLFILISERFFAREFFQHNSYGLVNIYFADVPETSFRYILIYPFNYVYVFNKDTHTLQQPYLKGNANILCKDPEHFSSVVQFDWTSLSKTPEKLKITCQLNMYEQVYHYLVRLPKKSRIQMPVPPNIHIKTYGSIELINVLIQMGVITLERVSP